MSNVSRVLGMVILAGLMVPTLGWSQKEGGNKKKAGGEKKSSATEKVRETAKAIFEKADQRGDSKLTSKGEIEKALNMLNGSMGALWTAAGKIEGKKKYTLDADSSKTVEATEFEEYAVNLYEDLKDRGKRYQEAVKKAREKAKDRIQRARKTMQRRARQARRNRRNR